MRLSEIQGERVLDVIADIIEPVANIAEDDAARELFEPRVCPDGMDAVTFFISRAKKALPTLIRGHKDDVIAILATVQGVTPGQYREGMTFATLFRDAADLLTDHDFLGFLAPRETEED